MLNTRRALRREQLLSSLSTYGAYHSNVYNKAIHVVFVPAIWWSAAVLLHASGQLEAALGCAPRCHARPGGRILLGLGSAWSWRLRALTRGLTRGAH
jgi:hypothetical protein